MRVRIVAAIAAGVAALSIAGAARSGADASRGGASEEPAASSELLFRDQVRPLLARKCAPCHNPGGAMYARLPWDDAGVVASHFTGVLKRLKGDERETVARWVASLAAAPAAEDPKKAIERALQGLVDAYNAGDSEGLRAIFAEDFVDLSDGKAKTSATSPIADARQRLSVRFANDRSRRLEARAQQIDILGDRALVRGSQAETLESKAGEEPIRSESEFLQVWRKDSAGRWRLRALL
jgi:ketosteroid isomerase-like protein